MLKPQLNHNSTKVENHSADTDPIFTKLFGPNFWGAEFFQPKFCYIQTFLEPKFLDLYFFGLRSFWTQNLLESKFFLTQKCVGPKIYKTEIFVGQNFVRPKILWLQKLLHQNFCTKIISGPEIVAPKKFLVTTFCPSDICPYQEYYLSWYWLNFDQTLKVDSEKKWLQYF